jgi:hypothetical protein
MPVVRHSFCRMCFSFGMMQVGSMQILFHAIADNLLHNGKKAFFCFWFYKIVKGAMISTSIDVFFSGEVLHTNLLMPSYQLRLHIQSSTCMAFIKGIL